MQLVNSITDSNIHMKDEEEDDDDDGDDEEEEDEEEDEDEDEGLEADTMVDSSKPIEQTVGLG